MLTVQEAENLIQEKMLSWGSKPWSAQGPASLDSIITTESIRADRAYPPYDRATMDGICVCFETFQSGKREFPISGVCAAGEPAKSLNSPEYAMEIMTGAPLPRGAQLVIAYEDIRVENGKAVVTREQPRQYMENVHRQASDCRAGDEILAHGTRLNGPRWGIAASFGYSIIQGLKRPKIKIISTGDEIVSIDQTPENYQIRGSNSAALKASLLLHGFTEVDLDHVKDQPELIRANYLESAKNFDVLIYTGGVSKGKFDYLPQIWQELGVTKHFHQVAQRPGKPLWFGTDSERNTTLFGLPGNPVSCLVCLHRYFLPKKKIYAKLSEDVHFSKSLTLFLPVKIEFQKDGVLAAHPLKIQNSGEFTALAESDGFLELSPHDRGGDPHFQAGQGHRFFSWGLWS